MVWEIITRGLKALMALWFVVASGFCAYLLVVMAITDLRATFTFIGIATVLYQLVNLLWFVRESVIKAISASQNER